MKDTTRSAYSRLTVWTTAVTVDVIDGCQTVADDDAEYSVAGDAHNVHTWQWKLCRFATNTLTAENHLI